MSSGRPGGFEGATNLADIRWLVDCPHVLYFGGDMDAHGCEIVHTLRANGFASQTIPMDEPTRSEDHLFAAEADLVPDGFRTCDV